MEQSIIIINPLTEKVVTHELVLHNITEVRPGIIERNGFKFQTIVPVKGWVISFRFPEDMLKAE